jgi:hypothetical protein
MEQKGKWDAFLPPRVLRFFVVPSAKSGLK